MNDFNPINGRELIPRRYIKRPVEICAFRIPLLEDLPIPIKAERMELTERALTYLTDGKLDGIKWRGLALVITTLEGELTAQPGDWIIRGIHGEIYPCKPDIFQATYWDPTDRDELEKYYEV